MENLDRPFPLARGPSFHGRINNEFENAGSCIAGPRDALQIIIQNSGMVRDLDRAQFAVRTFGLVNLGGWNSGV